MELPLLASAHSLLRFYFAFGCCCPGDLNYRLNLNDQALIYARIDAQDWPYLLSQDQLIAEKAAGNAFKMFKEGTIEFAPTYKYTVSAAWMRLGLREGLLHHCIIAGCSSC